MLQPPEDRAGPAATLDTPNVLLIVLDTLRADHLGVYRYPRPTSPFLDGFSENSYVFERAVSASSWTLPSHATLFTGLFPRSHGTQSVDSDEPGNDVQSIPRVAANLTTRPLASEAVTIAELAREHGLETGAICGNVAFLYNVFGLDQGFATYVDKLGNRQDWIPVGLRLAGQLRCALGRRVPDSGRGTRHRAASRPARRHSCHIGANSVSGEAGARHVPLLRQFESPFSLDTRRRNRVSDTWSGHHQHEHRKNRGCRESDALGRGFGAGVMT